ncbi:MAG TPA: Uma2 family endonuclease [Thermoanaerobaculia bacterium]|nr:Uma2 family endonuclease [Thermoanaerobaculia bacterium]
MAAEPLQRRLFTTEEYHVMLEAGILHEDDRVELIEGEIWQMSPMKGPHLSSVARLDRIFQRNLGEDALVVVQSPIHLDDFSEPQPDLAVVRFREDFYESGLPTPEDVLLVVEVADSSLPFDRDVKAVLYARHGIPEVWLRDIPHSTLLVHRDPSPQGYRDVRTFRRGERLSPLAFPDLVLEVDAILGPPTPAKSTI